MRRFGEGLVYRCAAIFLFATAATSAQASVSISANPTKNMTCSAGVCSPTAKAAVLNVNDLANMLAGEDVKIITGAGAVTITTFSPFSWTSPHRLTLDAYESVTFRAPVAVAGKGAVTIVTNDGGTGGDLIFFPGAKFDFSDTSSSLIINGDSYRLVSNLRVLAAKIAKNPLGSYALANDYDAAADGTFSACPIPTKFNGHFNGLQHEIENLSVEEAGFVTSGLFCHVQKDGALASVRVRDAIFRVHGSRGGVGILAGVNQGTIFNASSSGYVKDYGPQRRRNHYKVGGLVGVNYEPGKIISSSSSALLHVVGRYASAGGLVGYNRGSISFSFVSGTLLTSGSGGYLGGLVGRNWGPIDRCYVTAATEAHSVNLSGGLIGIMFGSSVAQSYSTTRLAEDAYRGGLVGALYGNYSFASSYWDLNTSRATQGTSNVAKVPGIMSIRNLRLLHHLPEGFDRSVWGQSPSINNGYPYLLANPPPQ